MGLKYVKEIEPAFLKAQFERIGDNLAAVVAEAVFKAAAEMSDEYRSQARAVFTGLRSPAPSGQNVEKSIRANRYLNRRKGKSVVAPASVVYFNADWWRAQIEGATIGTRNAKWLVIALPAAIERGWDRVFRQGARGMRKRKGSDIEAAVAAFGKLRFVPIKGGRALLVADAKTGAGGRTIRQTGGGRATSVPLFLLVRRVTLRPKFDLDGPLNAAAERAVRAIVEADI